MFMIWNAWGKKLFLVSVSGRSGAQRAQRAQSSGAQLSPEVHGHLHSF